MSLDNPNGIESSVSNNSKARRTFLKRATAGAAIVSIPGRSAWAGIAGSIVASGHGSETTQGQCTQLLSHGYWKNHPNMWPVSTSTTFKEAFGGEAFSNTSGPNQSETGYYNDKTLLEIISSEGNGKNGMGGPNNVNVQMVAMYLNAAASPNNGVYYPAIAQHGSLADYGQYLYREASRDRSEVGVILSDAISTYHSGTSICNT